MAMKGYSTFPNTPALLKTKASDCSGSYPIERVLPFCREAVGVFYHHHHDVRLARISLTLSLHVSLSFIAFGRSSGLHPISSHSCCVNVWAGRPAFDWPYAGFHRSTSLTISSLLRQQCPVCLVRLAWIVFVIGGRWPYSWRCVGCCCQDQFSQLIGQKFVSSHG